MVDSSRCVALSPLFSEVLGGLKHERADGGFPAGLIRIIVRGIKERDLVAVHDGPNNRRCDRAGHTRERINVHNAVVPFSHVLRDPGDAQTCLRAQVERVESIPVEDPFQVAYPVLGGHIE
jgi:hypothetical protein